MHGQRFEVELNGLFDIRYSFFQGIPLRLAPLQFGAPSIETVLVLFDDDGRLAGHAFSVSRPCPDRGAFIGISEAVVTHRARGAIGRAIAPGPDPDSALGLGNIGSGGAAPLVCNGAGNSVGFRSTSFIVTSIGTWQAVPRIRPANPAAWDAAAMYSRENSVGACCGEKVELESSMGQDSMGRPPWRECIHQGVQMLQAGRPLEAISAFDKACDLNPKSAIPQLYLALGWDQQYVPGDSSPENVERARLAEAHLRRALELEPGNRSGFALLGRLARNEGRAEDADQWFRRALREAPDNADTRCKLGEIDLHLWWRRGKPPDELEQLIQKFEKAVELDPTHEAGMRNLSMIFRMRAAMRQNSEEAREDLAAAQSWQERAADAYAESIQKSIAQRVPHPLEDDQPDAYLNFLVSMTLQPVPPPPPPPPPLPPPGITAADNVGEAGISFEPIVKGAPRPIRVPSAVQAEKLITKVELAAAYAQSENPLRFVIVIGRDGHIVEEIFIAGNLWLRKAAVAALRQWVYELTLVNAEPVKVVTEVRVGFQRGK